MKFNTINAWAYPITYGVIAKANALVSLLGLFIIFSFSIAAFIATGITLFLLEVHIHILPIRNSPYRLEDAPNNHEHTALS